MKRALLAAVLTLTFVLVVARRAHAEAPRAAVVIDASEAADTWLHEHCSYRGVYVATAPLRPAPREPIDRWLPPSQPPRATTTVDVKTAATTVTAAAPTTSSMIHVERTHAGEALAPTLPERTTSTPKAKKAKVRRS